MARGDRAIAEGELTPQGEANTNLNQLMLGCWALCVGHIQVNLQTASRTPNQESAQLPFPLAADDPHVNNCQRLINSYQWRQPLDNAGITKAIDTLKALNYY